MSKYRVCPHCEGEGFVSKIGAFTGSDMDEWFADDQQAREEFTAAYLTRGGAYDERCPLCKSQRVVTQQELDDWAEQQQCEAQRAAELRIGC